jgi:hypothetical protein
VTGRARVVTRPSTSARTRDARGRSRSRSGRAIARR